jgi:hypothetical protein
MLSVALIAGTFVCLALPALHIWAGPLLVVLFLTNAVAFWAAIGLSGVAALIYFYWRT